MKDPEMTLDEMIQVTQNVLTFLENEVKMLRSKTVRAKPWIERKTRIKEVIPEERIIDFYVTSKEVAMEFEMFGVMFMALGGCSLKVDPAFDLNDVVAVIEEYGITH